jgi:hypothetical protein
VLAYFAAVTAAAALSLAYRERHRAEELAGRLAELDEELGEVRGFITGWGMRVVEAELRIADAQVDQERMGAWVAERLGVTSPPPARPGPNGVVH